MTWDEFKNKVEEELLNQGLSHDVELWYINVFENNNVLEYGYNLDLHKFAIQNWRNANHDQTIPT